MDKLGSWLDSLPNSLHDSAVDATKQTIDRYSQEFFEMVIQGIPQDSKSHHYYYLYGENKRLADSITIVRTSKSNKYGWKIGPREDSYRLWMIKRGPRKGTMVQDAYTKIVYALNRGHQNNAHISGMMSSTFPGLGFIDRAISHCTGINAEIMSHFNDSCGEITRNA